MIGKRNVYLVGPMGSGKTAVGVALAGLLDAEIVSADAVAVYRGLDIGTAKPSVEERSIIPHHLVDVVDPSDAWSVRRTQDAVRVALADAAVGSASRCETVLTPSAIVNVA